LILGLLLILNNEVAAQSYTIDFSHLGSTNFIEARNAALAGKDELAVSFLKKFYRNESNNLGIVIHYSDFDPIRDSTSFKLFYHELIPDSVITYREILRKLIEAGPNGLVEIGNKHVYFPPDLQLPLGNKGKYGPKR